MEVRFDARELNERTLRFGPSFALEKTTTASPADLVVAAYTAAIAAKGAGTGACRMLAVGRGPSPLYSLIRSSIHFILRVHSICRRGRQAS